MSRTHHRQRRCHIGPIVKGLVMGLALALVLICLPALAALFDQLRGGGGGRQMT
jgi:hypothetical protein